MRKYCMVLSMVFLLLSGCIKLYFSDSMWAPDSAPVVRGEFPQMRENADRCNKGFYTGLSTQNIEPYMSQRCEKLGNGNSICAIRAIDRRTENVAKEEYDPIIKKKITRCVKETQFYTFMINTYINEKGIVYDCRAEDAQYSFFTPDPPRAGSLADRLPGN